MLFLPGCRRADQRKLIFIIVPSQDNPFFKAEADAAADRAEKLGYRARVDSHDDDAYRQDNLVDAAIASNASVLILDNAGADSSVAAVRRATSAGIPVFLIDREIAVSGIARAQIIADNDQGARLVAAEFARSLGKQGEYAELLGRESDTNAQIRTKGFHAILDSIPGLKRVSQPNPPTGRRLKPSRRPRPCSRRTGRSPASLPATTPWHCGAAAAVASAGLKSIVIVGFDGSPDAIAAIRAGSLRATALQPAVYIAKLAVDEADRFLKTGSTGLPERQIIPCDLVTRANANDYGNFEKLR